MFAAAVVMSHRQLTVSHPMVVVDCSSANGADVASQLLQGHFDARGHSHPEQTDPTQEQLLLLSALTGGTLVLDNVHKVSAAHAGCIHFVLPFHH
jgi:hypothetical protein